MWKIFVSGNYFIIQAENGGLLYRRLKYLVEVRKATTGATKYTFNDRYDQYKEIDFSQILDIDGIPFISQAVFETFIDLNTGFNSVSGGSETGTVDGNNPVIFDTAAQSYFDYVGDMDSVYKTAINKMVVSMKTAGIFNKGISGMLVAPVIDDTKTMANLFDVNQKNGVLKGDTDTNAKNSMASPYTNELTLDGISANNSHVETSINPFNDFTNGVTILEITTSQFSTGNYFDYGCFIDTTNAFVGQHKNNSNSATAQIFSASGPGSLTVINPNTLYRVMVNRTDKTTVVNMRRDSVEIATNSAGGTPPNANMIIGGLFNPLQTTPWLKRDKRLSMFLVMDYLDDTEVEALENIVYTFQNDVRRPTLRNGTAPTKQLLLAGNSFSRYWNQRFYRGIQISRPVDYEAYTSLAENGYSSTNILSNISSLQTLYNASLSNNDIIIWEIINDVWFGADFATATQNLKDIYTTLVSYGFDRVFMGTATVRTHVGNSAGLSKLDFYLLLDAINVDILANPSLYGTDIIDFTNINLWQPRSGFSNDTDFVNALDAILANGTYFYQAETNPTHPTEQGIDLCVSIASSVINS